MATLLEDVIIESPKLSEKSKPRYLKTVREFMDHAGWQPSNWTGMAAQSFYNKLLRRMKPQSANATFTRLRYASRRVAQLHNNPQLDFASAVETAKGDDPEEKRALTYAEAGRLLDACRGPRPIDVRDFAIVTLGLKTGMRRFSMTGIHLSDFGRDRKLGHQTVEITLKGGKRFRVPLASAAIEALRPWKGWLTKAGVKGGPLFRSVSRPDMRGDVTIGTALSDEGLYKALKKRAEKAGIEFYPHLFRHTFVTWCKEAGMSDYDIAAVTGHVTGSGGNTSTVSRTYTDYAMAGVSGADAIANELWE